LRALLVTTDFPPAVGGIQAVLYNTVRHFTRTGVVVVAPDHPDAQAFDENQSFPIYRVGPAQARSCAQRVYRLGRMTVESLRVLRREGADVVLCGHPFTAPIGLAAKRLLKKPYVVWTYASELVGRQRFLRRFLQPADAVLVISAHTRRLVTQLGVPIESLLLIPCAPDCGVYAGVCHPPSAVRSPLLLTVARMDDLHKGHDIMLRAMPLIAAKVPNVRWVVVGDGPLRSYYEKMAGALGVQDVVHFVGTLPRTERDRLLASCDVFVMVSRDRKIDGGGEGFGIVYLEANAFGKPVVAGRVAGALDAVVDDVTGLLVDPENELEVAEAVVSLLINPELAVRLGRQGQARVRDSFTWEKTATAVEEVLLRTLIQSRAC